MWLRETIIERGIQLGLDHDQFRFIAQEEIEPVGRRVAFPRKVKRGRRGGFEDHQGKLVFLS
jgi:hypothetical protein